MTPSGLPIDEALPHLTAALLDNACAVLAAPPGAGKTTRVPLALLDAPWRDGGLILMLEPRRLAARAAAGRMAELLGEPVGQTVGYRVRLESRVSAQTRIEVITVGQAPEQGEPSETARRYLERNHEISVATLKEDFDIGEQIQRGLDSGANTHFRFARFEGALTHWRAQLHAAL